MLTHQRAQQLKFVTQVYRMRMLGLGLGALPVAAVLHQLHAPIWQWAVLLFNGYVWPHVAYWRASRTERSARAEQLHLMIDAGMGGLWVGLMHFNLMPSALMVSMLVMDRISAGGWRLLGISLALMANCCVMAWLLTGQAFAPASSMLEILACVPMLMIYPACLSMVNFALARRVRQQNRLLDRISRTDALTGLPNRTHWLDAAATELTRFQRKRRPAALVLLDVDHFKLINDQFGHGAGDALLGGLADLLREQLRGIGTPGRFGGDEFGIVLPETSLDRALAIAERICRQAERANIHGSAQRWTLSLGVAVASDDIRDVQTWLRRADEALYRAKSEGRNRVSLDFAARMPLAISA